jgi:hypothetical protein
MTWEQPGILVRVALDLGPNDEVPVAPDDPAWTDLSDRVMAYKDDRGRDDVLQPFGPGTAQVVLDNSDRMLDPSNPDGLVYTGDDKGWPLCPVQIDVTWGGNTYPKFYGYLGPEAWPGGTAPRGPVGTVTLHVVDRVGHSPNLPSNAYDILVASLHPEWWLRMDEFEFPVLDDGSPVPDYVTGGSALVEGTTGISRPINAGGGSWLILSGDHIVRSAAADIMPDGDQDKFTVSLLWARVDVIPAGEIAVVAEMVNPTAGIKRWRVYVDGDDGYCYVETYDVTGTLDDSGTIVPFLAPRFDALAACALIAVWDAASGSFKVWFGGVSTSLSVSTDLYESDLIFGPNPVDVRFGAVTTWRREFTDEQIAGINLFAGLGTYWNGDDWSDRLGHWIEATGRDVSVDDTNQWHVPSGTLGLWGINQAFQSSNLPDTLAEAFQQTVESGGGARWATKDGYLRARTIQALTDVTWADDYATPVLFTDANTTLGAGEYRHAGVEVTGLRIDRVINDAAISYNYSPSSPPDVTDYTAVVNRSVDRDSRTRFGVRSFERTSIWSDWPLNQQLAELLVDRYAWPFQEFENVHLDPTNDPDLTLWLVDDCELEKAVDVTYTPAGADPVTVEGLNIQRIAWDWTPSRWTVDLMVAAS